MFSYLPEFVKAENFPPGSSDLRHLSMVQFFGPPGIYSDVDKRQNSFGAMSTIDLAFDDPHVSAPA